MSEENQSKETAPTSINLTDLSLLLEIIDLASSRGAFKAAELSNIGAVYDRVGGFLKFVSDQQQASAEQNKEDQAEEVQSEDDKVDETEEA